MEIHLLRSVFALRHVTRIWYDSVDNFAHMVKEGIPYLTVSTLKMAIYCPQGSGTLRQQLLSLHDIAWYCMVSHCSA